MRDGFHDDQIRGVRQAYGETGHDLEEMSAGNGLLLKRKRSERDVHVDTSRTVVKEQNTGFPSESQSVLSPRHKTEFLARCHKGLPAARIQQRKRIHILSDAGIPEESRSHASDDDVRYLFSL